MALERKKFNPFPIKGFREGLLVKLGHGDWDEILESFLEQIDSNQDFFQGAKVAVDVDEQVLKASELGKLRDLLSERGIVLFAVLGKSEKTQSVSESLGLLTERTIFEGVQGRKSAAEISGGEDALLVRKSLRSGVSINYPGSVIVDGDVNPGAEIRAGRSIYVLGKLQGLAYAGESGSLTDVIFANNLSTNKLRIANISIKNIDFIHKLRKTPKKVEIVDSEIIISDWKTK